jgi:hypothetical protein
MPTITLPLEDHAARVYTDADGILTVEAGPANGQGFRPRSLRTTDGSAAVAVDQGTASIQLQTTRGALQLTPSTHALGDAAPIRYTDRAFQQIGQLIRSDGSLRESALKLRRAVDQTLYGYSASARVAPTRPIADIAVTAAERRAGFMTRQPGTTCRLDETAKAVRQIITAWNSGPSTSEDLAARTWAAATTLTDNVLQEVTHCSPDRTRFIGPWGSYDIPPTFVRPATVTPLAASISAGKVKRALGPFVDVLRCLTVDAKWSISTLNDFAVSIPGVSSIPLGVTVRLNRTCTDKLKAAVTAEDLVRIIPEMIELFATKGINAVIGALGLSVAGIPVVAGVTVGQVVLVALLVLAAHALIVAGQLVILDTFGLAPNGVKLTYPAMPGVVSGVINPVVGLVVLANTPVIVTPR